MAPSTTSPQTKSPNKSVETTQPAAQESMTSQPVSAEEQNKANEDKVGMRGGEACPGRFCFIVPCPIPCNCCIIPCP
ncbi:hypothetical protein BJ875DRAFT_490052 [Amylocarpus encephaloides]|uniref:Uncharacterized protein n=1 Tax=Amylocarpus encephaloides TaxID=45428 RepID=A0A9P8C0L0_9HELO|nr:hypothetical protein BJ875DRAFT_490052 [Amylocarpus encephaloides]